MKVNSIYIFGIICLCFIKCNSNHSSKPEETDARINKITEEKFIYVVNGLQGSDRIKFIDTLELHISNKIWESDSSQYQIKWSTKSNKRWYDEYTGVKITEDQIWIHPPRFSEYEKLRIAAFPMVEFPIEIGNNWNWELNAGGQWVKNLGYNWCGDLLINHSYEVKSLDSVNSLMGNILCHKILATTSSQIGESHCEFFYNSELKFVKMIFHNMDGSIIKLELLKVENAQFDIKSRNAENIIENLINLPSEQTLVK